MLKHGTGYIDVRQQYYEAHYTSRVIKNLKRQAAEQGFDLIERTVAPQTL